MGRKIGMREFRRNYNLHLLNYSSKNYHPGNRVDIGKSSKNDRFQIKLESIVRELDIPNDLEDLLASKLKSIPYSEAEFAQVEITRDFMIDNMLDISAVNVDLRGKVDLEKVVSMKYQDVKVRELADGKLRDHIEELIEKVQHRGGESWTGLKNKGMVIKLFYATEISILLKKKSDFDIGAGSKLYKINAGAGAEGNNETRYQYTFGSDNPFAVYFESVQEFIE